MNIKRNRIITLVLDAALVVFLVIVRPLGWMLLEGVSDCIFTINGMLCPSCGGTRSVYYFFGGDFAASWKFNPFFFILIIYAFLLIAVLNLRFVFGIERFQKPLNVITHPITAVSFAVAFALFGILRNFI